MKKKWICLISIYMSVLMLSGCAGQIPDMTEEERAAISEYAAELLLQYDTSKPSRLVDLDELEPEATEAPEETSAPEGAGNPEETDEPGAGDEPGATPTPEGTENPEETEAPQPTPEVVYDPLEETLLLPEGVTLQFKNYEVLDSYREDTVGQQMLEANAGNKILVFYFTVINNSADVKNIDMLQDNIRYKIYIGEEFSNGLITMLENDLTTYMGSISAGEAVELMLFTEVKESALQGTNSIAIEFACGEKRAQVVAK